MRNFYLIIIFAISLNSSAQFVKKTSPFSIRGTAGIPRTIASQMFRTAFNGLFESSLSMNAQLFGNVFAGVGIHDVHFLNHKQVFAGYSFPDPSGRFMISYNTRLNCIGGFIKFGYDQFFEKTYITYALNSGFLSCTYLNVIDKGAPENQPAVSKSFGSAYVQPELSVNFMTDGRLTFSILLAYGTMFQKFDPKAPHFNNFEEVSLKKNNVPISWINIGFGFNVLLGDIK